ncbi:sulfite exporter TauE/SafE family protein [Nostocales cyanobacterium LEGE 11386]|nr:sulfite exporter TauE/SafE family protein [Nostocales cyanobacterium LEGE 11386]
MSFEYWFMFPISIAIATIALASGVEGATFFTPLFIIGLGVPTEVAIGTGLMTEVFGFTSGLYAYIRRGLIDYKLGRMLLIVSIPAALLGTWLGGRIPPDVLKGILCVGLFAIASSFLRSPESATVKLLDQDIEAHHQKAAQTCITTNAGETICYTIDNRTEGRLLIGIGGLFLGMVSTGLGELNGYFLLQRCHVPSKIAVATSVFIVAITALIASIGHAIQFIQQGGDALNTVLSLVIFTAPGVIIGAQIGSVVASRMPQKLLERGMGILFILVGILVLAEVAIRNAELAVSLLDVLFSST